MSRAPALRRLGELRFSACEQIQDRHSYGYAVSDLVKNDAVRSVGDVRIDLHATIHRPRVQDENVTGCSLEPLARNTEYAIVFPARRDVSGSHSLELQTKNIQRVGPFDRFFDSIEDNHSKLLYRIGKKRTRAAHCDLGSNMLQPPDVGSGNARVEHIAADTDALSSQIAQTIAQCQQIEETLRGVLVSAIAGVDDVRLDSLREKLRSARRAVTNDHHVNAHRLEIARRIDERLSFLHARPGRGHVHRVGREPLLRELE